MKVTIFITLIMLILTVNSGTNLHTHTFTEEYLARDGLIYFEGKPIYIVGVSWFGFETEAHVVHGLWARNWEDMLEQMKSLGFNGIRIPLCPISIHGALPKYINYDLNPDLKNLTSLEILDKIVKKADELGLYILLDMHRIGCEYIEELWYNESYSEDDVISDLVFLAERYSGIKHLIGIDIKNEPHGRASWGTGDIDTDFRLFAERAGELILAINQKILIFVEGVEMTHVDEIDSKNPYPCFWGENLMGVKYYPVRLPKEKVVYSPHVYGPSVYNMSYFFTPEFPNNLPEIWDLHFGYIIKENLGTLAIGEWGGRYTGIDREWQDVFADYLKSRHILYFFYWSWNPNSGDTKGVLLDDWKSVNEDKIRLLMELRKSFESYINSIEKPEIQTALIAVIIIAFIVLVEIYGRIRKYGKGDD